MDYTKLKSFLNIVSPLIIFLSITHISEASKAEFVTCGTILKLMNTDLRLRLHSHDVKYGSGSGQQSVTAVDVSDDYNSHWLVRPVMGETCKRGAPIKCNTNIRLQHVSTKKNLHSHYFSSPLSSNQEVSCYGDDEGEGDSGDNWTVVCKILFITTNFIVKCVYEATHLQSLQILVLQEHRTNNNTVFHESIAKET